VYTKYHGESISTCSYIIAGADPEFGKGGCTLLKRLQTKKKGKAE